MKMELEHFNIGDSYGGDQTWFRSFMMRIGGCAAETVCDMCIYLAMRKGMSELYPFDTSHLSKNDYVAFSEIIKPYLKPRWSGINTLEIYKDGVELYLKDIGCRSLELAIPELGGGAAEKAVIESITSGMPVSCLVLHHKAKEMRDYVWHWFLLNGYEKPESSGLRVQAVTYGSRRWLDLDTLMDTGYDAKGGLVLFRQKG